MSMFDNSAKIFLAGKIPQNVVNLLHDIKFLSVYRILDVGERAVPKVVRETGTTAVADPETINALPSGIVLIIDGGNVSQEIENFVKLWDDASTELPDIIELVSEDESIAKVVACLIGRMQNEVRSACGRNVDLRGQIAFLREEVEQANIQLKELHGVVSARDAGAHTLLQSVTVTAGFVSLKAGQTLVQKLPLKIHAWSLGAVGIFVSAAEPVKIRVRLIAAEDDTVLSEWTLSIDDGVSWQLMRLLGRISNRYQLVHLELKRIDEGDASVELGVARSISPDEEISIDESTMRRTLAIQLWGGGAIEEGVPQVSAYVANQIFEIVAGSCMEKAPLEWMANAEPMSIITKPPKWFGQFEDFLRIHPSVGVVAAARANLQNDKMFDGIAIDFIVPDKQGKLVQFCLAAVDPDSPMPSAQELADFAEENGRAIMNDTVTTTNWISTVPGGLMKTIPLLFNVPKNNINLVLMTRVNGNTAGYCNSNFKNLRYIYKTRKYNG